ncbi:MAG: flavodoxin-dependent (E)-4-hydroxy-3-methylbut-2-enyl-diphosphate synthase [Phycisphaerae bacterium]|nr:flavodoxin-dependent (E)-4-hydroxy-3-methylbut-2-enyl-diphosphate synthase [Phycisphaerae bacterium]
MNAANAPDIPRRSSRGIRVGALTLGGDAPVRVQSMTTTRTADADATLAQIGALVDAGAELVRVAAATRDDTAALGEIVAAAPCPIIADVHFHFDRALEAIDAGVAKIRLNPGNIRDRGEVRRVIAAADDVGVAIRVGVNAGSVGAPTAAEKDTQLVDRMVAMLAAYLEVFDAAGFENLVLSAKSHDALTTVAVNRRLAARWDWPLHLGVTHAGPRQTAAVRSAAALGALLADGIGDTIRLSYAGDPVAEVRDAVELLASLRLRQRRGVELIACPQCGRLQMDIQPVVEELREALAGVAAPLTVAVMGCVVNGPGEAADADVAVCCGNGKAMLYRHGEQLRTLRIEEIVPAVLAEVAADQ